MVEFIGIRPKRGAPRIVAATQFDLDQLEKVGRERSLRVKITYDRSSPHNRWYRGLVSIVADGVGIHPGVLHAQLKFEAGLIKQTLVSPRFGVAVLLESTKFSEMDETRFCEFVDTAVELIFSQYLPGVSRKDVFNRVADMVGPRPK